MSRDERAAKRARTTAAALTKAAYDDDEPEIAYDTTHYNGDLNGSFMTDDAVEFFAGGDEGGGGKFESENRAMARPAAIAAVMEIAKTKAGLESGNTVIDVGAGTGLMISTLTDAVGKDGKMFAVDLSERFVSFLKKRFAALCKTSRLKCSLSTAKTLPAVPTESCDVAFIIDVYHHFTHPRSFMRSLAAALKDGGTVVLVDFHRDESKMIPGFHPPKWALEHIRGDQATFRSEVLEAGFELLSEHEVEPLPENYIMVFKKKKKATTEAYM